MILMVDFPFLLYFLSYSKDISQNITLLAKVFPKPEICHNPANGTNNTK